MPRKKKEKDNIIGEVSNDAGDHAVFEVPGDGRKQIEKIMKENKVEREGNRGVASSSFYRPNSGDPQKLRYSMDSVSNQDEDLEPEEDNDTSDDERSEQPAESWCPFW
jgi:hypothetical protein